MIPLPWLDRLFSYLLGFAAWCLWLGPESTLAINLEQCGLISLTLALIAAPVLLLLHRRGHNPERPGS